MLFLKVCKINFLISTFGFGSGTVFFSYVYSYFVATNIITIDQYNTYVSITELLPGATSVKILTLISYDLLGFLLTIFTILIFVVPTILIIYIAGKLLTNKKFINFFTLLGFLFTPVLGALILNLTYKITIKNIENIQIFIILLILTILTYILQRKYIKNYLILISINSLILISYINLVN